MFHTTTLRDAVMKVATNNQLEELEAANNLGAQLAASLGGGRHRLNRLHQEMWDRALPYLLDGRWRAQGFERRRVDSPTNIHSLLWHTLRPTAGFEAVSCSGLEFVGVVVQLDDSDLAASGADSETNGDMTIYEALISLAGPADGMAYRAILQCHPDGRSVEQTLVTGTLDGKWAPALIQKLRDSEWSAHGIGEGGSEYEVIIPADWDQIALQPYCDTIVYSADGQPPALWGNVVISSEDDDEDEDDGSEPEIHARCVALFEALDKTLPQEASKKVFFREALRGISPDLSDYRLKKAWAVANLREIRRLPGLRSTKRID